MISHNTNPCMANDESLHYYGYLSALSPTRELRALIIFLFRFVNFGGPHKCKRHPFSQTPTPPPPNVFTFVFFEFFQ